MPTSTEYTIMNVQRITLIITALVLAGGACIYALQKPDSLPYDSATALSPPPDSNWPQYGNDAGGNRYSALDQINRSNVSNLEIAWVYQAGELDAIEKGEQPFNPWQATPILVADTLIACSPTGRILALDPASGQEKWSFDPKVSFSSFGHTFVKCRGVSSYVNPDKIPGETCQTSILWGTADLRRVCIGCAVWEALPGIWCR